MLFSRLTKLATSVAALMSTASAIQFPASNPSDADIMSATNEFKANMLTFYDPSAPGSYPGLMLNPNVYYWWQVGGMMGQLIHHWNLTGNSSLNDMITEALTFQMGSDKNFEPQNQSKDEGNDDQLFWAFAAMDAAEYNFPAPDPKYNASWLGLAQAVFNRQYARWDTQHCNGGLRWQILYGNTGYDYKNLPANGGYFNLAARLARFTGNDTYAKSAEQTWDWLQGTGLLGPYNNSPNTTIHVFDGFGLANNCTPVNTVQYTYNFGNMLMGAAMMYNLTESQTWHDRTVGLLAGAMDNTYFVKSLGNNADGKQKPSFGGQILTESADEFQTPQNSDNDDPSFKAFTIRWMAVAGQLCPTIAPNVTELIAQSAIGAAGQCSGQAPAAGTSTAAPGSGNNWCGRRWYQTNWDGYNGYGEQLSAMSVMQNQLIGKANPPLTAKTGGNSISQPDAGGGAPAAPGPAVLTKTITGADKFGAAIMTILAIIIVAGGVFFMITGD